MAAAAMWPTRAPSQNRSRDPVFSTGSARRFARSITVRTRLPCSSGDAATGECVDTESGVERAALPLCERAEPAPGRTLARGEGQACGPASRGSDPRGGVARGESDERRLRADGWTDVREWIAADRVLHVAGEGR